MSELKEQRCVPCEGGAQPLDRTTIESLLQQTPGWSVDADAKAIARTFDFKNFYHTMAFANAVAWIAHRENHHPNMEVSYKRCRLVYSTHAIGGLSENDFICAAKVNELTSGATT
jgi:4a-hydroxytetrahydrobiopterin dehydratase